MTALEWERREIRRTRLGPVRHIFTAQAGDVQYRVLYNVGGWECAPLGQVFATPDAAKAAAEAHAK